jgi:hypothetical protein
MGLEGLQQQPGVHVSDTGRPHISNGACSSPTWWHLRQACVHPMWQYYFLLSSLSVSLSCLVADRHATLRVLHAVLQATRKGLSDTTQVKPGSQWAELLLMPDTTDWLLSLNPSLTAPAAASSPLAQASRQLVVAFCSLAGDIFPKPPAAPTAGAPAPVPAAPVQVAYVAQMLRLVLPWVMPAQQVLQQALAGDEGQLVDACRALSALCAGHKPGVLEAASAAVQQQQPQAPSIFTALEELSRCFLAAGGVSATSSPEPWLYECTEMLLECWSGLLAPQCGYNMVTVPPPHQAVESAGRTAAALVEAALADAAAGALEVSEKFRW